MQVQINQSALELIVGDITAQEVDVIVNAANSSLLGGGGVDGAIHRVAGCGLLDACRLLNGCPTGQAKITGGFGLKVDFIIHAVGPVYQPEDESLCAELLQCAYQSSLELAHAYEAQTVAFPAISTGIYGYPMGQAADISLKTVIEFLSLNTEIETVRFVLFNQAAYVIFEEHLKNIMMTRRILRELVESYLKGQLSSDITVRTVKYLKNVYGEYRLISDLPEWLREPTPLPITGFKEQIALKLVMVGEQAILAGYGEVMRVLMIGQEETREI